MTNSKWYVSQVHLLNGGPARYDAVKVVEGVTKESGLEATVSYVGACKRAEHLNMQDQLRKVRVK